MVVVMIFVVVVVVVVVVFVVVVVGEQVVVVGEQDLEVGLERVEDVDGTPQLHVVFLVVDTYQRCPEVPVLLRRLTDTPVERLGCPQVPTQTVL
mgnify:CR=1 FL=1